MIVTVLSGKGGTGKTTIAVSLASAIENSQYIDCDVEEPNGALFLQPDLSKQEITQVLIPEIDANLCTYCKACAEICQFNALAAVGGKIMLFPDLCHHCGACRLVCEPAALTETDYRVGIIESNSDASFVHGKLDPGRPSGLQLISAAKDKINHQAVISLLDAPPGSSCAVVHTLADSDFALLVAEPTPFGLHDFEIALDLVLQMKIPAGVVINKSTGDDALIESLCREKQVPVMLVLPFQRQIAVAYSRGDLPVQSVASWQKSFRSLYEQIRQELNEA